MPTITAPSAAPGRLPRPPITTTAKESTMISTPRPGTTETVGAVNAPAERGEHRAERESHQVVAVHVDAHRPAHLRVVDHRAEQLADAGAVQQPGEPRPETSASATRIRL